jgi:hypothetical protein
MKNGYFVGRLMVFKNEDDLLDEQRILEITEVSTEGVEIAFDDRGERMYLKFRLSDLARAIESLSGDA